LACDARVRGRKRGLFCPRGKKRERGKKSVKKKKKKKKKELEIKKGAVASAQEKKKREKCEPPCLEEEEKGKRGLGKRDASEWNKKKRTETDHFWYTNQKKKGRKEGKRSKVKREAVYD